MALYQELENARGEAYAIHNLGRLYLPAPGWAGDPQQALGYFERAAPFLEKLGDRQVMASNTYGSARALAELGRPDAARERLAASFGLVEELRTETSSEELRIAFFATKQHYYDLYVDVLMRLDEQEPGKDWAEKAFEVSEHRRARTLLDTLGESASEIRRGADPALLEEEAAIQAELNVLERRRRALVGQAPANRIALAPIEKSVRQNREKLDDVRRRLRNAAYDRLAGAKPLTLSEIRGRLLNSRTLLLVYSLGEERSFLWAVSRDAVRSRVLAQGRAEIEVAVEEARDLLTSLSQDRQNARQRLLATLGDQLLGPVADELTYKRLVIVADGALLYLPFAALPKPGAEPGPDGKIPFLVEHHEIVNLPSASLLEGLRREFAGRYPAPKQIAVFADPMLVPGQETPEQHPDHADLERSAAILGVERFEPLPGTRDEARVILDLAGGEKLAALGADATKEKIVGGELKDYQILHFATHGIVNREAPELSGLVLSLYNASGLPVDGFLHLHEIYNLDLSAELVVLSACETGLGPEVRGEGLIGLTRGFMYAGVPRILVNLWRVCDRGTAELMRGFYWSLFEVGAAPAEALRAAQISLLENDEWNHPIYWASFVLQGDWRLPGGGGEDFDIEGAFLGGGVDDEEDMDLQFPGYVCADPSEPWMRTVYEILRRLRQTGDSSMNGNQASSTGIDLETGQPIQDALSDGELRPDPRFRRNQGKERERAGWHETFIAPKVDRRPAAAAVDSLSLASSGWGVVFPKDLSSEIRENLQPLLDHRRRQATRWNEEFYKELVFESGDTKQRFTSRYEVMHGPVDPARGLPYYLMIVGGPKEIPYSFQYLLDVPFAVGRLYFDNPEDYGRYARSVIEAERGHHQLRPEMTFFSVAGDKITTVMADRFVDPLYMSLQKNRPEWTFRRISNGSKDDLRQILGGPRTPSLLLTAAHGLPCKKDSPQQRVYQGAILCQDWHEAGAPGLEHCFSAADLDDQAHVHGLVVFLFGCYSAGTPQTDNYPIVPRRVFTTRAYDKDLASEPFLSALAQRLLAHPNGGALAVIGHVDRAWSHSFGGRSSRDFTHIEALLRDLLDGYPVGSAMDWMHERFAEQSTMLTEILNEYGERRQADRAEVARLWRANNDARNFVVLGDPAVHLAAGPRAALSGMSLLYDRAPESRRPLKRVNWRQFLGRWEPEQVRGLSPVDAVRRIRSLK